MAQQASLFQHIHQRVRPWAAFLEIGLQRRTLMTTTTTMGIQLVKLLCAIRTGDAWIQLCFKVDRMAIADGEVIESGNVQDFSSIFEHISIYSIHMYTLYYCMHRTHVQRRCLRKKEHRNLQTQKLIFARWQERSKKATKNIECENDPWVNLGPSWSSFPILQKNTVSQDALLWRKCCCIAVLLILRMAYLDLTRQLPRKEFFKNVVI